MNSILQRFSVVLSAHAAVSTARAMTTRSASLNSRSYGQCGSLRAAAVEANPPTPTTIASAQTENFHIGNLPSHLQPERAVNGLTHHDNLGFLDSECTRQIAEHARTLLVRGFARGGDQFFRQGREVVQDAGPRFF